MSKKIIKVNTDQGRYRVRRIDYDRFAGMRPGDWDYEAVIGGKKYLAHAGHGGSVAASYGHAARTSAVLAIQCVDDGTVIVMGAQIPAGKATQAKAAVACLAGVLDTGWVGAQAGRWLWDGRSTRRGDEAWDVLVRAYEILVAGETAAA